MALRIFQQLGHRHLVEVLHPGLPIGPQSDRVLATELSQGHMAGAALLFWQVHKNNGALQGLDQHTERVVGDSPHHHDITGLGVLQDLEAFVLVRLHATFCEEERLRLGLAFQHGIVVGDQAPVRELTRGWKPISLASQRIALRGLRAVLVLRLDHTHHGCVSATPYGQKQKRLQVERKASCLTTAAKPQRMHRKRSQAPRVPIEP